MLIACQLPDFAISVCTLLATMLCFNCDGKCALLDAHSTTVAAVGALLIAHAVGTPRAFAINRARVLIACLVLHMRHMFALATTMLCLHSNHVFSRLTASATLGTALGPCCPVSFAINWARSVATHSRRLVAILMRALLPAELRFLCDCVRLVLSATTAEILSVTTGRNCSIACGVWTI